MTTTYSIAEARDRFAALIRQVEEGETAVHVTRRAKNGLTSIAAVIWHELLTGVSLLPASKRRTAFANFLQEQVMSIMPVLAYDQAAAEGHAQERARLTQMGLTPSLSDGQTAAVAAINNLILVTRNTADFAHFAGLRLENWFQAVA
jgi:tRNA(fMet)-specific endonuclease VapC